MACLVVSPSQTPNNMANKNRTFLIEIPNENAKQKAENLQEAFEKFRKSRQHEMKVARMMEERALAQRQNIKRMEELRQKFLEGLKKYFGVPYAKRYHEEDSPYYGAPLFLDCCGLIRRVLQDLKEDFGFVVGGGNQAYLYDTLPQHIKEEDIKPGDLVFISATYYDKPGKKWKKQRHDMVHVEVWLGDGEKTIGARWQKGVVQVFDSYKFVSKSYHSMTYHFKSIDTWLMGICKSFCPEHSWRSSVYNPSKKSIFTEDEEEQCQAAEEEEGSVEEQQQAVAVLNHEEKSDLSGHIASEEQIPKDYIENSTIGCKKIQDELKNIEIGYQSLDGGNGKKDCESTSKSEETPNNDLSNVDPEQLDKELIDDDKTNCPCPECCPVDLQCVHNELDKIQEGGVNNIKDMSSNELTSSLECFEVIASPECRKEVERAIATCPIEKAEPSANSGSSSPSKDDSPSEGSNGSPTRDSNAKKKDRKDSPPKPVRDGVRSRLCHSRQPAYYVSPGNGSFMVETTLQSMGWRKLEDRYDESFKLKWVECKSQIDYNNFREGYQLVNHISNIGVLTTKLGLLCSLQEYERVLDKIGSKQRIQLSDFVPETIRLTNTTEKQKFVNEVYQEGEVWICKPIGQNQGKGIYMINSSVQLREKLRLNAGQDQNANSNERRSSHVRPSQGRIIQRYIMDPLLLNSHKFDIRAYMFIASTNPYVVLYHPGYVRLSCVPYSPYSEEAGNSLLLAHLTNQYIQKKHPSYSSMKDETVWSFERLQSYIDEHHAEAKGLADSWIFTTFTKRMQQIMLTCFHSVRKKLHRRSGFFDLLGFDFMIDENFKVWLIEVNVNPSLNTNCQVLKEVIPTMVDSTVRIALEIFEKTKKGRSVFPLENKGDFVVLYNGEGKG